MNDSNDRPAGVAAEPLREIHWLKRNPQTERMLRAVVPMMSVVVMLLLLTAAVLYYLFNGGGKEEMSPEKLEKLAELTTHLLLATLLLAGSLVIPVMALRSLKHRLGTDGRTLYVKLADGRQWSLAPEQLVHDGRRIAYRDRVFPVQTGNKQALYESGEVETYLAPLLARARRLGPLAMFRYQFAHREPTLMAILVYGAVALAVIVATGMWRYLLDNLG